MNGDGIDKYRAIQRAFVVDEEKDNNGVYASELNVDGSIEVAKGTDRKTNDCSD